MSHNFNTFKWAFARSSASVKFINILFSKRNKLLRTSLADKPKDQNIFLIGAREIKSWQSLIETKISISLNKLSYEAFLSAAMIITYPNPLSFRLNNEAIIPKEYLSMTKYLVFKWNKL